MGTIDLGIDPSKSILGLSGGIDSALGVYLAIKQYGASNVNVLHYSRTFKDEQGESSITYGRKLIEALGIDPKMLLTDFRPGFKDMGQDFIPMVAEKMKAVDKYTLVRFDTEQPIPTTEREIATHLENIYKAFPPEKHTLIGLQYPFKDLGIDRGEVVELYYQHNIQHLLPLIRSCSIQADNLHLKVTSDTYHSFKFTKEDLIENKHCGMCYKCIKRKYGFKSVEKTDPTTYLR